MPVLFLFYAGEMIDLLLSLSSKKSPQPGSPSIMLDSEGFSLLCSLDFKLLCYLKMLRYLFDLFWMIECFIR